MADAEVLSSIMVRFIVRTDVELEQCAVLAKVLGCNPWLLTERRD